MTTEAGTLDLLLLGILPYVAFFTFFLETVRRYRQQAFTYSSLSSQFLENEQHFWSLVPFHYGIIVVLTGHVVAWLLPRQVLAWNSHPLRLYVLEVSLLVCGILALLGFVNAVIRRLSYPKIKTVTTASDWVLAAILLLQVASGVYVAVFHPWGSSWFASAMAPYLWSLVRLAPDLGTVAALPLAVKLHIVNAYLLIGFFPFTRLVHILVVPNHYLWRKLQVVRWWRRATPHRTGGAQEAP
ncbi:MAG: respiratory nitrate reductase subunit gamma [Thermoanaerobaculaceae bacterium]|nr:respiratory nitrate reductase subunit gamma [Thermoanaerobaculaceae bacterium]MDI9620955.1 respiratory nitrate reductase subunit gamma [Acidobacteriota bacterium]NLH10374.1 respiratory nitrate reductase subunit gamma [Holophagae bacterium]HPW56420.1 respiratory nitrate reductase subunit gamma [Thermoanaerobaculaceae bacterium]